MTTQKQGSPIQTYSRARKQSLPPLGICNKCRNATSSGSEGRDTVRMRGASGNSFARARAVSPPCGDEKSEQHAKRNTIHALKCTFGRRVGATNCNKRRFSRGLPLRADRTVDRNMHPVLFPLTACQTIYPPPPAVLFGTFSCNTCDVPVLRAMWDFTLQNLCSFLFSLLCSKFLILNKFVLQRQNCFGRL